MGKKILRQIPAVIFAFLFLTIGIFPAYAEENVKISFGFDLDADGKIFEYRLDWWQQEVPTDGWYYITLPAEVKGKTVRVNLTGSRRMTLNGTEVKDGDVIAAPSKTENSFSIGDKSGTLYVLYTSNIPGVFIDTASCDMSKVYSDKSHKEPGKITILNNGKVEYAGDLDYIKGRGNSSWSQIKKPFNIKLSEKADLFGYGKSKNWCLLADYVDVTHLRNKTAVDFADSVGLEYSSKSEIVDLFIDGEYIGNYTLIEKVEIGENRVEITDLEKLNEEINSGMDLKDCSLGGVRGEGSETTFGGYKYADVPINPVDITGGYLLECELNYRYDNEVSGFVTDYGQPMILKSPEYASKAQVEYIRDYYQQFEDAVLSDDGYNSRGKHYSDYMDIDSMVKMYVFQEYVKNLDAGITSFYLYKDVGGKLVAAPVWDFDMALGHLYRVGNIELSESKGFLATGRMIDNGGYTIVSLLARRPEFRQRACREWENNFRPKIDELLQKVDDLNNRVKDSTFIDKNRWTEGFARPIGDVKIWRDDKVVQLKDFLYMRAKFMDEAFSTDNMFVTYYANGGSKAMLDKGYYNETDNKVTLDKCRFDYGKREFLGWNTQPDGSGESYEAGQEIELTDNLVLYAQWSKLSLFEIIGEFFSNLFG